MCVAGTYYYCTQGCEKGIKCSIYKTHYTESTYAPNTGHYYGQRTKSQLKIPNSVVIIRQSGYFHFETNGRESKDPWVGITKVEFNPDCPDINALHITILFVKF